MCIARVCFVDCDRNEALDLRPELLRSPSWKCVQGQQMMGSTVVLMLFDALDALEALEALDEIDALDALDEIDLCATGWMRWSHSPSSFGSSVNETIPTIPINQRPGRQGAKKDQPLTESSAVP